MKKHLRERWQQLPARDRQLLGVLALFLLTVSGIYGLWLPGQQRLEAAQAQYLKQQALAQEMQRALPAVAPRVFDQPLASRLSESAASAGFNVEQFELDAGVVRITLSGEAVAVLNWLHRIEQEGASFENLSLEKRETRLQARLLINNPD